MSVTPEIDPIELAEAIAVVLQAQLDDFHAETVTLTRDEAIITLGLVNAVAADLKRQRGEGG